jgi:hypothetical protein
MYHTFKLYRTSNRQYLYKEAGIITINMALVETILSRELPTTTNDKYSSLCLLEVSFNNKTVIVEPQNYEEFQLMMDQMSQR